MVAAGVGYGAALLAACGPRVTALEEDPALLALARHALTEVAPEVSVVSGPLSAGWPGERPYDVILLEGAVQRDPARRWRSNCATTAGGCAAVICTGGRTSQAVLAEAAAAGLRAQPMFDCATPVLPSLRPAPAFVF